MKLLKNRWILLGGIALIAFGAFFLFRDKMVTTYLSEPATKGDIEVNILADGKMEAFEQIEVGAQVSGQIKKMHVKLGQMVKKGDLIAEIDDLPQQNAVKDSDARLKNVIASKVAKEAQLVNARINYERQTRLIKSGATTQSDLDVAEANLKVYEAELEALEAQVAQAQIALDTAELDLTYTKIVAPIDGTVVAIVVKEGQTVNAVQTAPTIVKVANLSKMTIKAQISEADIPKVDLGMRAYFTILGEPNEKYEAILKQIEPATEKFQNSTGNTLTDVNEAIYYNGLFYVDNVDQKFYIDMTSQIYLVIDEANDVLTIPTMATRYKPSNIDKPEKRPGYQIVWVLTDKANQTIEPRYIKAGISNNVVTEVKEGLNAGEMVVLSETEVKKSKAVISHPRGIRRGF